jgi:phosphoribosyl-dephospho-CoA transferase
MPEVTTARHDLVWLAPGSEHAAHALPSAALPAQEAISRLGEWIAAGRPLVVARQPLTLSPGRMLLGLPLPASQGKLRLGFDVPRATVLRSAPPPPLAALREHLPASWRPTLDALLECPTIRATNPRAFGSAGMQAVTGVHCIEDGSDLDLLLAPASRDAALAALASLTRIDALGQGPRIDGEFVDLRGRATSWRELASGTSRILLKQRDAVSLADQDEFLNGLDLRAA